MTDVSLVAEKIREVKEEMKRVGLWATTTPAWVQQYGRRNVTTREDFSEWLQFVYLPNMQQVESKTGNNSDNYIAPQAKRFFGDDINKGKLLRLLIELDALS